MKLKDETKRLDPTELKYAHLVKFLDEDMYKNRLQNMRLRCTHLSYIVGNLIKNNSEFIDVMNQDERYLYFKSVTDAIYFFGSEHDQTPFVLGAESLAYLGIKEPQTKDEIKERLKRSGMYFNFTDEEEIVKKKSY